MGLFTTTPTSTILAIQYEISPWRLLEGIQFSVWQDRPPEGVCRFRFLHIRPGPSRRGQTLHEKHRPGHGDEPLNADPAELNALINGNSQKRGGNENAQMFQNHSAATGKLFHRENHPSRP